MTISRALRLACLMLAALLCLPAASRAADKELYIYNWTEYMPDSILKQFTKETGIKVNYSTYDTNEAMYAKLKMVSGGGYDLVVPSSYYVKRMAAEGMLARIDKSRLKNLKNMDPKVMGMPFDPANDYSVPYMWGTTGICVNKTEIDPKAVTSWKDLWKPEFAGRLLLTNDVREIFGIAFKVMGVSINETDPAKIEAAYKLLAELAPGVRVYDADSPYTPFLNKEVTIGMMWNGNAFLANTEGESPDFAYIYPKEGVNMWMDCLAIPAQAKNKDAAHTFIDFLMRPEIAAAISEAIGYSSPNLAALKKLPKDVRENRMLYPAAEDLQNAEMITDVGEAITIYQSYWEKLKANQ